MTRIIPALSAVSADYDVLFCDLWGCVHNGRTPYPAAIEALQGFRMGGGKVCLMTNAPRPARFVEQSLDAMGVPRSSWDVIATSGDAAQAGLFAGAVGQKVWHLGPEKDLGFFEDAEGNTHGITRVPFEEAEGIVCTGPFHEEHETPEDYRAKLMLARERGLKLLCANPDIVVDLGEQRIYCAGAIAAFYEELGGTSLYFGKPHPPIYDLARRLLNVEEGARILAIGDGINTDVAGASAENIDAIFVTGGLAADHFGDDPESPDPVRLFDWLRARMQDPSYAMGRLR